MKLINKRNNLNWRDWAITSKSCIGSYEDYFNKFTNIEYESFDDIIKNFDFHIDNHEIDYSLIQNIFQFKKKYRK